MYDFSPDMDLDLAVYRSRLAVGAGFIKKFPDVM
jgi:hypothetical protein